MPTLNYLMHIFFFFWNGKYYSCQGSVRHTNPRGKEKEKKHKRRVHKRRVYAEHLKKHLTTATKATGHQGPKAKLHPNREPPKD